MAIDSVAVKGIDSVAVKAIDSVEDRFLDSSVALLWPVRPQILSYPKPQ